MEDRIDIKDLLLVLLLGIVFIVLSLLSSCAPRTQYVEVERVVTEHDTVQVVRLRDSRDSVRDSISHHVWTSGDTVFVRETRKTTRIIERSLADSAKAVRTEYERIPVPYPVAQARYVRQSPTWKQLLQGIGGAVVLYLIIRLILLIRRKNLGQ